MRRTTTRESGTAPTALAGRPCLAKIVHTLGRLSGPSVCVLTGSGPRERPPERQRRRMAAVIACDGDETVAGIRVNLAATVVSLTRANGAAFGLAFRQRTGHEDVGSLAGVPPPVRNLALLRCDGLDCRARPGGRQR